MVPRRRMMPEEFEASRSAKSFAWCAGFFRRRYEDSVLISTEEVDQAPKRALGLRPPTGA
jgi:hypothetical protein